MSKKIYVFADNNIIDNIGYLTIYAWGVQGDYDKEDIIKCNVDESVNFASDIDCDDIIFFLGRINGEFINSLKKDREDILDNLHVYFFYKDSSYDCNDRFIYPYKEKTGTLTVQIKKLRKALPIISPYINISNNGLTKDATIYYRIGYISLLYNLLFGCRNKSFLAFDDFYYFIRELRAIIRLTNNTKYQDILYTLKETDDLFKNNIITDKELALFDDSALQVNINFADVATEILIKTTRKQIEDIGYLQYKSNEHGKVLVVNHPKVMNRNYIPQELFSGKYDLMLLWNELSNSKFENQVFKLKGGYKNNTLLDKYGVDFDSKDIYPNTFITENNVVDELNLVSEITYTP